jgi:hypothetical protein
VEIDLLGDLSMQVDQLNVQSVSGVDDERPVQRGVQRASQKSSEALECRETEVVGVLERHAHLMRVVERLKITVCAPSRAGVRL